MKIIYIIYIYIYILGSFPVAGMKKKMCEKKMLQEARMVYYPNFSKYESQYSKLYCDTGLDRHGLGDKPGRAAGVQGVRRSAHGRPRYGRLGHDTGHDTVTTRPAWAHCARPVRVAWVQGVHLVHSTQFLTQCTVSFTVWTTVYEHCS